MNYNCPICDKLCVEIKDEQGLIKAHYCFDCTENSPTNYFEFTVNGELDYLVKASEVLLALRFEHDRYTLSLQAKDKAPLNMSFTNKQIKPVDFSNNDLKEQFDERLNKMFKLLKMKNFA